MERSKIIRILKATVNILAVIAIFIMALIMCSCKSSKTMSEQRDSIRVETIVEVVYVPDTVYVDIPAQVSEKTTSDSTSFLENDYAYSNARINQDGTLYHDLSTKPQKKPVEIKKEIRTAYKNIYKDRNIVLIKTVEVEKKLTWWQSTCITWFGWLLLFVVGYLGWKIKKRL